MSATSRRAARREAQLGAWLGTPRIKNRPRFESAPDVEALRWNGFVIQGESKSMKKFPAWMKDAITQAESYGLGAIGLVALFELGSSEPLALMRLRDFCRLLGLAGPKTGEQLGLAQPQRRVNPGIER